LWKQSRNARHEFPLAQEHSSNMSHYENTSYTKIKELSLVQTTSVTTKKTVKELEKVTTEKSI